MWIHRYRIKKISSNNTISGWALNASGINYVNIYLDGSWKGTAKIGLSRTDVANAYPGYTGASTSGFSYLLDINTVTAGAHSIKVRAVGNDGIVKESTVNVSISKSGSSFHRQCGFTGTESKDKQ